MALEEDEDQPEGVNFLTSDEAVYVFKNYNTQQLEQRAQYRARQRMPDWVVKEDFVISGMSGRFPESESLEEFEFNLYQNIDMVVENERRWPFGYLGLPRGSGKLKDLASFDHRFFHITEKEANLMDAQERIMLEVTFEALWDAGLDPSVLAGTQTGVFIGQSFDEYMAAYCEDHTRLPEHRPCFFALLANVFDFRGPQMLFDTACASGFSALHQAMLSLRSGQCERALVLGLNLGLRAGTQFQFLNLNMMSRDGHCKCLDEDADGYAKGEAFVAVLLQKKSEAKRIYGTVIHTKTNCDGHKDLGITYPSFELQRDLIEETYQEAGIDPLEVEFCEAHCTGTQAGDPSEMRAITEAMCKGRTKPLLIGAIKSVIGHTEASSGLCALVKGVLCFEREMIPANLHLKKINHRIEGLVNGILQPVITNTPYTGKYIALNCFGFGGVNVHAVIAKHEGDSVLESVPTLPRLVTFCGRTEATIQKMADILKHNPDQLTPGFLSLLNDVSKSSPFPSRLFEGMPHRGFVVLDQSGDEAKDKLVPVNEVKCQQITDKIKPPVCFVFTGMGSQWTAMGEQLTHFPTIKSTLERCVKVLKQIDSNFNLMKILTDTNEDIFKSPLNCFVAIAAIQIGLVDLLAEMDITADYIIGHSIGELVCAYADGCLTAEETIACAYWRGQCIEALLVDHIGAMAAIACTWEEAIAWCSKLEHGKVWPACHNGADSVTISGKKEHVEKFLKKLREKNENIFAKLVNSSGVAFHSPLVESIRNDLLDRISDILVEAPIRKKSSKWISSTYANNEEDDFDVDYLVDNLILPVRFHDALKQVPGNAVFIELGPHSLLQAIIKRNYLLANGPGPVKYVPAMSRGSDNNVLSLLQMLGGLYSHGLNPTIERLYPKVKYPVPRGTASLHSLIRWQHDRQFTVLQYPDFFNDHKHFESARTIDLQHPDDKHLQDHCIDGRILFPATGYLFIAWTHVAKLLNVDYRQLPIVFEDVTLHRATIMSKTSVTNFDVFFHQQTGQFSITEGSTLVASGKIQLPTGTFLKHQELLKTVKELESQPALMEMKSKDIYKEFRLRGYDYGPDFQAINQIRQVENTLSAKVIFKNWVTFVDGLVQMAVLGQSIRGLFLPVRFGYLRCDPALLFRSEHREDVTAFFDGVLNICVAPGIEYHGVKANLAPRKTHTQQPIEETFEFVPHDELNLPYIISRAAGAERCQEMTELLEAYQDSCWQILADFLQVNEQKMEQFEDEFKTKVASPVLLKFVKQLKASSNVDELGDIDLETLEQDLLFRTYQTERFLRSQLETFCDNLTHQQLSSSVQVLEVNQTPAILADSLLHWLNLSSIRVHFTYRLLHSGLDKFTSMRLESTDSQHEWLAEKSKFPTDLANIDLIVFKDASTCPLLASVHAVNFETLLESAWNALAERGFTLIILRDQIFPVEAQLASILGKDITGRSSRVAEFQAAAGKSPFKMVSHKSDVFGVHAYLMRKLSHEVAIGEQHFLPIFNSDIKGWFGPLQERIHELTKDETGNGNIWLLANEPTSGVLGFISCLRKESLGGRVRCILNSEGVNALDVNSPEVSKILQLDLFSNVLGPNRLLGTYKHFTLPEEDYEPQPVEHCYLNVTTRGDLASLKWFESQHKHWPLNRKPGQTLVTVYYAPLNFRDIMLATGKLPPDALPDDMGLDDCILGLEFAGRDDNNNRVMGMINSKGLATSLIIEGTQFLWPIPATWTMEEASTVPVAYATAYYALILRGRLQPGESVLIHSGSGAVGQAAIAICLSLNCQLFITVGSDAKRDILMKLFPDLKPTQFASSRDIAFSRLILQATGGRGVDVVLNSLAAEKLQASVDCMAEFGRFLEIGKFDLSQNSQLDLSKVMQNKTFHGILLDNLLTIGPNVPSIIARHREQIWELMKEGIDKGVVRPLQRTIFAADQAEEAFRYMASGKHIGKVVVCIRPENEAHQKVVPVKIPAIPRTVFFSHKSYIITGGLGGFGLELIGWMIDREARHFVVTSRSGIKDLYQRTRLDHFARVGAVVKICTQDASIESGAELLVEEAESLGPLGGIFHLAMILSDGLFENQTVETFEAVLKPKSDSLIHLDRITRNCCPQVDYFVAFSSVSCGGGNAGQTNYGFANSVMERIVEQRTANGLHGLAIQWGPIGDVGYVIDNSRGNNEVIICGSLPQRMPSCLAALDRLLQRPFPVCSNLIKADFQFDGSGKTSLIQAVAHILGVKDYEKLQPNVTLGDLGMDSLMDVEVKQALERDYDVVLTMVEVRKLTIAKIREIEAGKAKRCDEGADEAAATQLEASLIPAEAVTYLNEIINGDPIIFLPQIDATFEHLLPLAAKLNRPVIGLNWTKQCGDLKTVTAVAAHYIEVIERTLPGLENCYDLLGYSFGGIVAIEMSIQLHQRQGQGHHRLGPARKLVLLDASPKTVKLFTTEMLRRSKIDDKHSDEAQVGSILMYLLTMPKLAIDYGKIQEMLLRLPNTTKRIEAVRDLFKRMRKVDIAVETLEFLITSHYNKMLMMCDYECDQRSLPGDLILVRASQYMVSEAADSIQADYWLSEIVTGQVHVHILNGDHQTFITENYPQLIGLIRNYFE